MPRANADDDYFHEDEIIRRRWQIVSLLGAGAYGQVFLAKDYRDKMNVAIKTEKLQVARKSLCMEVGVMRAVNDSRHVPYIVACGRTIECRFMVMECLGESLDTVIKSNPTKTLPLAVACQIGLQAISALRDLHDVSFIHRDVKPANFAFGKHPKVHSCLFVYDFGLARIHLLPDGKPRKKRTTKPGFRGTLRYASLASHFGDDLGRVDDLIPIYYSLIEMIKGGLPWKGLTDKQQIKNLKEFTPFPIICNGLPVEFLKMGVALHEGEYRSKPKYGKLASLLTSVLQKMNVDPNLQMWIPGHSQTQTTSASFVTM